MVYKVLIQLAFPTYIIALVITVIVASECSSRFAKIIGKGNPVAVLDTMILLYYTKFFNAIVGSFYLLLNGPAYGSQITDLSTIITGFVSLQTLDDTQKPLSYFLLILSILSIGNSLQCSCTLLAMVGAVSAQSNMQVGEISEIASLHRAIPRSLYYRIPLLDWIFGAYACSFTCHFNLKF